MGKKIMALLALLLVLPVAAPFSVKAVDGGAPQVDGKGGVVMEAVSGRVLFAQGAQEQLAMASTTKILTALITLEQPDQDTYFTVDSTAIQVEGSSMGLQVGDQASLGTLAIGMLLPSGNDAANAAAVRIAGSQEAFAQLMNERAAEIGMTQSHFVTPSGLDAPGHYTTAYDMALLTREALENPRFREICSQQTMSLEYGNPPYKRWLRNHNKLLERYPYAIGVKTGFTDDAGRCLVSAAEKNGVTLIVVTLNASDDFNTHQRLYEYYFDQLTATQVGDQVGDILVPVTGGELKVVTGVLTQEPIAALKSGEQKNLRVLVETPHFLYAPVKKDSIIGTVKLYHQEELVYESPLVAGYSVAEEPEQIPWWNILARLRGWMEQ